MLLYKSLTEIPVVEHRSLFSIIITIAHNYLQETFKGLITKAGACQ